MFWVTSNNFTAFTFSLRNISVRQSPIKITFKDELANNMPLKQVSGNIISNRYLTLQTLLNELFSSILQIPMVNENDHLLLS